MKENDKISQLFQDNQHKLDEMPSTLAWDRLEERLDARESHQKSFTLRRMAVAAAVVIALSMVALWSYINPLNHANIMSDTTAMFEQKQLASEIIASDAPAPARPILMSHRERSKYLTELDNVRINTKPVLADKTNKSTNIAPKVRPKPISPPAPPIAKVTTPIASADMEKAKEATVPPSPTLPTRVETLPAIDLNQPIKTSSDKVVAYNNSVEKQSGIIIRGATTKETVILESADVEYQESERNQVDDVTMDNVRITTKSKKKRDNKRKARAADRAGVAKNTTKQEAAPAKDIAIKSESTTTQSTAIQADSYEIPSEEGIDKFDWLLGKWADEDDNSFEEWYRTDSDTIEGKGYFVVDVDTTFTQSMRIVERNSKVYFMVNGQLVEGRFLLESYNNRSAIFKDDVTKDSKIILKKDADNTFSIIIDNETTRKERKRKRRTLRRIRKN